MTNFKYDIGQLFEKKQTTDIPHSIIVTIIDREVYRKKNLYVIKDTYHGPIMYINEESLEELYEPI